MAIVGKSHYWVLLVGEKICIEHCIRKTARILKFYDNHYASRGLKQINLFIRLTHEYACYFAQRTLLVINILLWPYPATVLVSAIIITGRKYTESPQFTHSNYSYFADVHRRAFSQIYKSPNERDILASCCGHCPCALWSLNGRKQMSFQTIYSML